MTSAARGITAVTVTGPPSCTASNWSMAPSAPALRPPP